MSRDTCGPVTAGPDTADAEAEAIPPEPPGSPPALQLEVQYACAAPDLPDEAALRRWAQAAAPAEAAVELVIRLVDEAESRTLNHTYRGKDRPTNVLSFPFEPPPGVPTELLAADGLPLGDLVICAPVVTREAAEQGKAPAAHWAHMVVHGVLHLRGYDHVAEPAALEMEALERHVLHTLGFPDPYGYTE